MPLKCGIVGLPNVGKSTLFNAITNSSAAEAQNYPFCTIEPNVGTVSVPDPRLHALAAVANSKKLIPATMEFVDIAGLVRGASTGEGLGNEFLSHIREVDAIAYVVRCFDNQDITHVEGNINPIRDIDIIKTELLLSDIESLTRRITKMERKVKGDKSLEKEFQFINKVRDQLNSGGSLDQIRAEQPEDLRKLQILTGKPFFYVCNVGDSEIPEGNKHYFSVLDLARSENVEALMISAQIESEIAQLSSPDERAAFLKDIGISDSGLNKIIRCAYNLLNLETFFTIGPKEAHAWTIQKGTLAPKAAGTIHNDFAKGFIRAEIISCEDYLKYAGELKAREAGKMRVEGKEYTMQDGDIANFRFNV